MEFICKPASISSSKSISSGAQYVMTLQNYFFRSILTFLQPTHQTEMGTAYMWGTTNSKSLGPIIMMCQSETLRRSQIMFTTLCSASAQLQEHSIAVPFTSQRKLYIMLCQNQFPELNRHILTFLHLIMLSRITY